jgi:hypothetical protein
MAWCERNRVGYIFGLPGNPVLLRQVGPLAEDAALRRLDGDKVRCYGDFRYAAKSWTVERRVIARVEAGPQGADSRFIVTNLPGLPKSSTTRSVVGAGRPKTPACAGAGLYGACLVKPDFSIRGELAAVRATGRATHLYSAGPMGPRP